MDNSNGAAVPPTSESKREETQHMDMLPIRIISKVVRGYGRGSSDLGIPTANLDLAPSSTAAGSQSPQQLVRSIPLSKPPKETTLEDLPTGIYWGFGRIIPSTNNRNANNDNLGQAAPEPIEFAQVYAVAASIGYNPTYGNKEKTVEPHLIAPRDTTVHCEQRHASKCGETVLPNFSGQSLRLSLVGYLRPELPFEGLDKLTVAIKKDITQAEQLAKGTEKLPLQEKEWVQSQTDL